MQLRKQTQQFIILKDEKTGFVFIQQLTGMLFCCKVWEFKKQSDFDQHAPRLSKKGLRIGDYRIIISFWGMLSRTPMLPKDWDELGQVMKQMAQFFYDERIAKHPEFYSKYLEAQNPSHKEIFG